MVHNTYWSVVGVVVGAVGFGLGLACLPCFSAMGTPNVGCVGWFGVFVWPFHGYREVCCMVFLTGHWSGYLGFWLDITAADHCHWKFLPLKLVIFFWKYAHSPAPKRKSLSLTG